MDKFGSKTIIGAGATFTGKIANARVVEVNGRANADLTAEKAVSSGVPYLSIGIAARYIFLVSFECILATSSVSIAPGAKALTVIPNSASSTDITFVRAITPPFAAP